jgi:hypothetical protein
MQYPPQAQGVLDRPVKPAIQAEWGENQASLTSAYLGRPMNSDNVATARRFASSVPMLMRNASGRP